VFEPGCGTGLLGLELATITEAFYTGMDINREILPQGKSFVHGDAVKRPLSADLYISSFFFSSLDKPVKWLKKVRKKLSPKGLFAVFAEYDYTRIEEFPETGLADMVRDGLKREGINTASGSQLDFFFENAGFTKLAGGEVTTRMQKPDRSFIEMHVNSVPDELPLMSWCVAWGVWRRS
jgi:SAM-dependent methyltransferase